MSYERVYDRVKSKVPDWELLIEIPVSKLESLIADAGLHRHRAIRLKQIAKRLVEDFGEVSLDTLFEFDTKRAQEYLMSLPGIGVKSAKCVLLYSLDRQVLPVDTHTARVAYRLGLVSSNQPLAVDKQLPVVVPPNLRFDFHVNAVVHGRAICKARAPSCDNCVLYSLCQSEHKATFRR